MHEVSQFCQPILHTLLFESIALRDEANESIFKYVHITFHFENRPIQIYWKFHLQKLKIFR